MARRQKKAASWAVDFSKVEGRTNVPDGDYHLKVDSIEPVEGTDGDEGYWRWTFAIIDDDDRYDGKKVGCNTSFKPQALWNLRNLLEALGADIPDEETELDPDDYVDMELVGTVEMQTGANGNGKYANVTDYAPWEEKSSKKGKKDDKKKDDKRSSKKDDKKDKKKGKKDEPEKLEASKVRDMDEDELEEVVKDYDLDVELDDLKTLRKKVNAVCDALAEKELLEDD